jgi:hypothetical protein
MSRFANDRNEPTVNQCGGGRAGRFSSCFGRRGRSGRRVCGPSDMRRGGRGERGTEQQVVAWVKNKGGPSRTQLDLSDSVM